MATIATRVFTALYGELVGEDGQGNRYYRRRGGRKKSPTGFGREQRWVVYNGEEEASRVPPGWHGWLHHRTDDVPGPDDAAPPEKPWIQPHQPNATGTADAYLPQGHTLRGGDRKPATGDYEAWTP
ncbi:MAG: NADH:ubiquinone oxidoreductase subunit NDUFA12 [Pseudomonadota bacterium]